MMDNGAVLYQDIWDVKPPGIFVFYWLGGRLFGFSEFGIHLLELVYLSTFAALVWKALRDRYTTAWVSALIPLALVGWYYAVAPIGHLTQVEALVGPFIFGSVWFLRRGGTLGVVGAGIVGGMALYFKLLFAPLLIALWTVTLFNMPTETKDRVLKPALLGIGLVIAATPMLIWTIASGLFDRVWATLITYPLNTPGDPARNLDRLVTHTGQYVSMYLPLILLAIRGIWVRRDDPLTRIWFTWIVVGVGTYLLQFWWGYYLQIILVPVALLALDGFDDLVSRRDRWQIAWSGVLALALVPTLASVGIKTIDLAQNGFGIGESRLAYQTAVHVDYGKIANDIEPLTTGNEPIFVLGDPVYYLLADRDQAIATNGWSPETWSHDIWEDFREELMATPPGTLLIDDRTDRIMRERSPETLETISELYELLRPSSFSGAWYQLRTPGP